MFLSKGDFMIKCPYCEQDYVWEVNIRDLPGFFCMCFECDTVWLNAQEVKVGEGNNYEDFMTQQNRTADWKAVEKIRRIGEVR